MKIECAIFDLDGTLVDSLEDLTDSMNFGLKKLHMPTHTPQQCLKMIGHGKENFARQALPEGKKHLLTELLPIVWNHYSENCCNKSRPYPQIPEILKNYKQNGIKLAVLTNKEQKTSEKIVAGCLRDTGFEKIIGETDSIPPKPQPDAILKLIKDLNVSPENCVMIGDSEADINTGKNAQIYTIAVTWGFRTKDQLQTLSPDEIFDKPSQLMSLLD